MLKILYKQSFSTEMFKIQWNENSPMHKHTYVRPSMTCAGEISKRTLQRIPTYRGVRPNFKVSGIFDNHGVIQYRTRVCFCSNSCGNCIIFCRPMSVSVCTSGSVDCKNNKSSRIMKFPYGLAGAKHCKFKCKSRKLARWL